MGYYVSLMGPKVFKSEIKIINTYGTPTCNSVCCIKCLG